MSQAELASRHKKKSIQPDGKNLLSDDAARRAHSAETVLHDSDLRSDVDRAPPLRLAWDKRGALA
jgi:hypothetical protein